MAKDQYDPKRLIMGTELTDEGITYSALDDGTLFPVRTEYFARYDLGPVLHLTVGIRDGRAVCFDMKVEPGPDDEGGLTGSMFHDIPAGRIIETVIGASATGILAMVRADAADAMGVPHAFLTPEEVSNVSSSAKGSRRGRPVSDDAIQRVAEIMKDDPYAFRDRIQAEMHVSPRTASRYADLARKRGYFTEDDK